MGSLMGRNEKRAARARFCLLTGREGGIRTHGGVATTPDFESGTFDHSATSPLEACDSSRRFGVLRREYRHSAHIGAQHLRNRHAAIFLLIVLQYSHQRAAYGQARAVEGVNQFVLP